MTTKHEEALAYFGDMLEELVDLAAGRLATAARIVANERRDDNPVFTARLILDQLAKLQRIDTDGLQRYVDLCDEEAAALHV